MVSCQWCPPGFSANWGPNKINGHVKMTTQKDNIQRDMGNSTLDPKRLYMTLGELCHQPLLLAQEGSATERIFSPCRNCWK